MPEDQHLDVGDPPTASPPDGGRTAVVARRWGARALLFAWAPIVLAVLASLMTGHWVPLPAPVAADQQLRTGIGELLAQAGAGEDAAPPRWSVLHVLYADCRCSRRVFDYLSQRSGPGDVRELVLLIGEPEAGFVDACGALGIASVALTRDELLRRLGIEAAPLFVVADPAGRPRYVGGYTDRKQGLDYRDLDVVARLRAGEDVEGMPVFGCGVSSSLQEALDPFGIKY